MKTHPGNLKKLAFAIVGLLALHVSSTHAGLVAHYNFTSAPGATAADESPAGNNDIPVAGKPTWSATLGGRSGVLSFANAGNLRLNPPVDRPANGAAFTVALWAKSDLPTQNQFSSLFANGQGGTNHFQIDSNGGGSWRLFGGAYNNEMGLISSEWTHLAVTWDGTTTDYYYNGALVGSGATNPGGNFDEFRIATNRANDANGAVDADIDDVRVYDEALDAQAIADLVTEVPGGSIIESFAADAEVIAPGALLTLSWEVGEFDTLEIEPGVGDAEPNTVAGAGSIQVMPTETTTYTITGTLDGNSQSREVFVLVGEAPIIDAFAFVGSGMVIPGNSVDLIWSTFGETSLTLDPLPGDVTGTEGTSVTPTGTTIYTLSATNEFGTTTASVTVTLREIGALIAQYNFTTEPEPTAIDESPGGTNSVDVTFGATSPIWLAEEVGRSGVLSFDDSAGGQIRLIAPPTTPLPGDAFTVMLWTKSDQPAQAQYGSLFSNGQGGTNHFQIDADGAGNWRLLGGEYTTPIGLIVDDWTHLAVTWDGATANWYYNGLLAGSGQTNPGGNFDEYRIGTNRANDGGGAVDAELDDIRVYDFALSAAAVLAAMNDSGSGTPFEIISIVFDEVESSVTLTWNSLPGKTYSIDASDDLESGFWSELTDGVESGGTESSFTHLEIDPGVRRQFYRVREE